MSIRRTAGPRCTTPATTGNSFQQGATSSASVQKRIQSSLEFRTVVNLTPRMLLTGRRLRFDGEGTRSCWRERLRTLVCSICTSPIFLLAVERTECRRKPNEKDGFRKAKKRKVSGLLLKERRDLPLPQEGRARPATHKPCRRRDQHRPRRGGRRHSPAPGGGGWLGKMRHEPPGEQRVGCGQERQGTGIFLKLVLQSLLKPLAGLILWRVRWWRWVEVYPHNIYVVTGSTGKQCARESLSRAHLVHREWPGIRPATGELLPKLQDLASVTFSNSDSSSSNISNQPSTRRNPTQSGASRGRYAPRPRFHRKDSLPSFLRGQGGVQALPSHRHHRRGRPCIGSYPRVRDDPRRGWHGHRQRKSEARTTGGVQEHHPALKGHLRRGREEVFCILSAAVVQFSHILFICLRLFLPPSSMKGGGFQDGFLASGSVL